MITRIDYLLDRVTMYRLVLYVLIGLIALAAVFSYFHASSFFATLAAPLNRISCHYLLGSKFVTRKHLCSTNQRGINLYYRTHPGAYHRSS